MAIRQNHGRPLTKAQKRELAHLSGSDQLTHGSHRARVQNALVAAGLARFVDVDNIPVCRITMLGIEARKSGLVPPQPDPVMKPSADDLRRHLRSLRADHSAAVFRVEQLDRKIAETQAELDALTLTDVLTAGETP